MVRTDAQKKADAALAKKLWRKELRLHPEKYADVIAHLDQQENVTQYLVELIRADLATKPYPTPNLGNKKGHRSDL